MPSPKEDQIPLVNNPEDVDAVLKNPKVESDGIFRTITVGAMRADSEPGISAVIQHMGRFFSAINAQESLLESIEKDAHQVLASETATDLQHKDAKGILQKLVCLGACLKSSDIHGAIDYALRVGIAYDRMNVRPTAPHAKTGRKQRGVLGENRKQRTLKSQERIIELVRLWEKAHIRGVSRTHACQRVAEAHTRTHPNDAISWRTVERAVKKEGRWQIL
jgi:hypothetical protein